MAVARAPQGLELSAFESSHGSGCRHVGSGMLLMGLITLRATENDTVHKYMTGAILVLRVAPLDRLARLAGDRHRAVLDAHGLADVLVREERRGGLRVRLLLAAQLACPRRLVIIIILIIILFVIIAQPACPRWLVIIIIFIIILLIGVAQPACPRRLVIIIIILYYCYYYYYSRSCLPTTARHCAPKSGSHRWISCSIEICTHLGSVKIYRYLGFQYRSENILNRKGSINIFDLSEDLQMFRISAKICKYLGSQ